jgi:hypothetical protein
VELVGPYLVKQLEQLKKKLEYTMKYCSTSTLSLDEITEKMLNGVSIELPVPSVNSSERVFVNGVLQMPGADYTVANGSIMFTRPPSPDDIVHIEYAQPCTLDFISFSLRVGDDNHGVS